jgi:hypothetical protein
VEEQRLKVSTWKFVKLLNVLLIAVGHDAVHYLKLRFLSPSLWLTIFITQSFVFKPNNPHTLFAGKKETPFKLTKELQWRTMRDPLANEKLLLCPSQKEY